jgi:hypothetical protein
MHSLEGVVIFKTLEYTEIKQRLHVEHALLSVVKENCQRVIVVRKTSFTIGYIASTLLKRFNLERMFAIRDETPIGHQFILMQICSGQNQPRLPCRQISFNDFGNAVADALSAQSTSGQ